MFNAKVRDFLDKTYTRKADVRNFIIKYFTPDFYLRMDMNEYENLKKTFDAFLSDMKELMTELNLSL